MTPSKCIATAAPLPRVSDKWPFRHRNSQWRYVLYMFIGMLVCVAGVIYLMSDPNGRSGEETTIGLLAAVVGVCVMLWA
jgi:hypothetical protein